MERDAKKFKVYDTLKGKFIQSVPPEKSDIKGGAVISADYIEIPNSNIKYVATCQNNNAINFWDPKNYIYRQSLPTTDIQLCIKYCGEVNKLFSGGCDCKVNVYDVNNMN